jgi:hypothetical protein
MVGTIYRKIGRTQIVMIQKYDTIVKTSMANHFILADFNKFLIDQINNARLGDLN